jgi:NADH-quinone oxidoreductase subunit N
VTVASNDIWLLSPELSLTILALVVIFLDLVVKRRIVVALTALVGLAVPASFTFALATNPPADHHGFFNMLIVDEYAIFFKLLFLLIGAVMILLSYDYVNKYVRSAGEFYALLLLSVTGMMLMASSSELITIYISLELTSIPLYIMAGLLRNNDRSAEAAVKYVLLGAMSSAILLYGFALLYGLTGTTDLHGIAQATLTRGFAGGNILLLMAVIFVLAGFGFKISAVPFHTWAPDIYEGAPTPATGFFSVGSKAAGFAALMRVLIDGNLGPSNGQTIVMLLAVIAILTMTLGNVVAIVQSNVKRMMAYSSIGQAGYILVGFAASVGTNSSAGTGSALFFLFVYVLTNLGAFAGIVALGHALGTENIRDFNGLRSRNAWLAVGTSICLLSLAGVPPMAGFFAKFYLFFAAWQQGLTWLVVIGVINSLISMGYYGYLVYAMFVKPPLKEGHISSTPSLNTALAISTAGIIVATFLTQFLITQSNVGAAALGAFLGLGH